jgi:hypothetical protein
MLCDNPDAGDTNGIMRDDYPVTLNVVEKYEVVCQLALNDLMTVVMFRNICTRHQGMSARTSEQTLVRKHKFQQQFLNHECTANCLVLRSEAKMADLPTDVPLYPAEVRDCVYELAKVKRKRRIHNIDPLVKPPAKRARASPPTLSFSTEFPIILSQTEKDEIIREFRANTNNSALQCQECSFCGTNELVSKCRLRHIDHLDISLLESAVAKLCAVSNQACLSCFHPETIKNSCYVLCHSCEKSVSKKRFKEIPTQAHANGLWIGDVPDELQGLSLIEEQCISRVRATRCFFKLSLGPDGQLSSRGNVCILPQDTVSFFEVMPPPLSVIRDEICVVLVGSPDAVITEDTLTSGPLLVRRHKIEMALLWLINNNPLYSDLDKHQTMRNLGEYPEMGSPIAVRECLQTNSAGNQGTAYHPYSEADGSNNELFEGIDKSTGLTATTPVDVDNIETTFKQRKLDALRALKAGEADFDNSLLEIHPCQLGRIHGFLDGFGQLCFLMAWAWSIIGVQIRLSSRSWIPLSMSNIY